MGRELNYVSSAVRSGSSDPQTSGRLSSHILKTSVDGRCTTVLGNPFHSLTALMMRRVFPNQSEPHCFNSLIDTNSRNMPKMQRLPPFHFSLYFQPVCTGPSALVIHLVRITPFGCSTPRVPVTSESFLLEVTICIDVATNCSSRLPKKTFSFHIV